MQHSTTAGEQMIEARTVVTHRQYVISWNDISEGLQAKLGLSTLRDFKGCEGGPGFDFWMYFINQVTEYVPDGITESPIDILDHIECIEEDGFTYPHEDDQKALPILKALAEIIADEVLEEGFYVDFC